MHARLCVCVRAFVHAFVRSLVGVCVRVRACLHACVCVTACRLAHEWMRGVGGGGGVACFLER